MKKLGFGAMRLPQIEADGQRVIDMETTKKMFDAYLAKHLKLSLEKARTVVRNGVAFFAEKIQILGTYPADPFRRTLDGK